MPKINLDLKTYNQLIHRIEDTAYIESYSKGNMNAHQTINFLIYKIQLALGEIDSSKTSNPFLYLIYELIDSIKKSFGYRVKDARLTFKSKTFDPSDFDRDKSLLVAKFKKFMIQSSALEKPYLKYGFGTKEEYIMHNIQMIDTYLLPFEKPAFMKTKQVLY